MTENEIGNILVESAIGVHRELGPGLLESVYEVILARELEDRGLKVDRQVPVTIQNKGTTFDEGFRADIIVESKVILELKSVERATAAHKKQVQTYLRLTGCKLGYLLNFVSSALETQRQWGVPQTRSVQRIKLGTPLEEIWKTNIQR